LKINSWQKNADRKHVTKTFSDRKCKIKR